MHCTEDHWKVWIFVLIAFMLQYLIISFCIVQSLDMQMKMVSDNMQDSKQKGRAADSDESFQGNW